LRRPRVRALSKTRMNTWVFAADDGAKRAVTFVLTRVRLHERWRNLALRKRTPAG
jgi:hypothetical protein